MYRLQLVRRRPQPSSAEVFVRSFKTSGRSLNLIFRNNKFTRPNNVLLVVSVSCLFVFVRVRSSVKLPSQFRVLKRSAAFNLFFSVCASPSSLLHRRTHTHARTNYIQSLVTHYTCTQTKIIFIMFAIRGFC